MTAGRTWSNINIGQYQLLTNTVARCPVRWVPTNGQGEGCTFSVMIDTHVGESWQTRKGRALAEARRLAEAFLAATEADVLSSDQTPSHREAC